MLFDLSSAADEATQFEAAYAQADAITRRNSQTFYLATGLLPRAARRAVRALYAFCRATDDLVDNAGAPRPPNRPQPSAIRFWCAGPSPANSSAPSSATRTS